MFVANAMVLNFVILMAPVGFVFVHILTKEKQNIHSGEKQKT